MDLVFMDSGESFELNDKVFNFKLNISLIHQVIVSYNVNNRKGNSVQKNRSEVSGSNRKPWKQKGTGRARAGSFKSPIWRSGGVTFGSGKTKYISKINKKMYKYAFKSILSELIRKSKLHIFNKFYIDYPKTKLLLNKLMFYNIDNSLVILEEFNKNLFLASRNLNNISICSVNNINIVDLVFFKNVIFTFKSIKYIEKKLDV